MANKIQFVFEKSSWAAAIIKVERDKIYGYVEEVVTNAEGKPCTLAGLLDDGSTIVLSGATALKTVDSENAEVDKKTLKTVYLDGSDAVLVPSSYEGAVKLEAASTDDLFDLEVTSVYQLSFEHADEKSSALKILSKDPILKFIFNYRADYEGADAMVISAQDEIFVLTGRKIQFQYLKNEQIPVITTTEETEEETDFGML